MSGEEDKKTLECLRKVFFGLKEIYESNAEKFLFFDKMRAPIKRIQNRYRYQVLMRLSDSSILPLVYEVCAEVQERGVLISVEENPTNLS